MFETEQAANAAVADGLATQEVTETTEQVENKSETTEQITQEEQKEDVTKTKAFSERLNVMTQKAKAEERDAVIEEMYGSQGIHTYAEYQEAVQKQQEQERQNKLIENGIDPEILKEAIASDPDVQWAKTFRQKQEVENFRSQVKEEKASLKDEPYFIDLEAEIDTLVESSLQNGKFVDVGTAYRFLVGQNIKDLISKSKGQTEKQTLANVQDRANRGLTGGSDTTKGAVDYSDVDFGMANVFGNDPKKIAERITKEKKKG